MSNKLPLSISMISYNEEDNIGRTLEAIKDIASEIIIVDSGSTDNTSIIAESFGAKVFREDWKGYAEQKNSALQKCSQEWILSLDCDEVPDDRLIDSIRDVVENRMEVESETLPRPSPKERGDVIDGYYINRKTYYLGKLMYFAWQPDWKLRLAKKSAEPSWTGVYLHEKLNIEGSTSKLEGTLVHYSYKNLSEHFRKTLNYAMMSAESYKNTGRKFRLINLIFNPLIIFIRMLIIRGAFLDGLRGLVASVSGYVYTFLKYMFLWELERKLK